MVVQCIVALCIGTTPRSCVVFLAGWHRLTLERESRRARRVCNGRARSSCQNWTIQSIGREFRRFHKIDVIEILVECFGLTFGL